MIRAAVIPGAWTAIVIADDVTSPPTVYLAESFPVGELRQLVTPTPAKDMRRVVSETECEAVTARLLASLLALRVGEVVIDWATALSSPFHVLSASVLAACEAHGIAARHVRKWRLWNAADHRAWVAGLLAEGLPTLPLEYEVVRNAGALWLESAARTRPEQAPAPWVERARMSKAERDAAEIAAGDVTVTHEREEVTHAPSGVPVVGKAPGPTEAGEIDTILASGGPFTPPASPTLAFIARYGLAPIPGSTPREVWAGIDPGSGALGIVVADVSVRPVRALLMRTLPVGEHVPLAKPRTIKRGEHTYEVTTRLSFNVSHVNATADAVEALLEEWGVTRLGIETADTAWLGTGSDAMKAAKAAELQRTTWLGGVIGDRARRAGIDVVHMTRMAWLGRVAGKGAKGGSGAERIPAALARGFAGWPPDAGEHVRDAAGVLLWMALPEEVAAPRVSRATVRTVRGRGSHAGTLARSRAKTADKRAAAGCVCTSKRHRRGCALAGGASAKMWAKVDVAVMAGKVET